MTTASGPAHGVEPATLRAFASAILFAVILRVTRSRVVPGHEEHVIAVLRGLTATMGSTIKGLHSATFGRAMDEHDQGMSLVSITEWDSIEAIQAVYGEGWAERTILPGAEEYILETTVEHFESTLDDVSRLVEQRRLAAG